MRRLGPAAAHQSQLTLTCDYAVVDSSRLKGVLLLLSYAQSTSGLERRQA